MACSLFGLRPARVHRINLGADWARLLEFSSRVQRAILVAIVDQARHSPTAPRLILRTRTGGDLGRRIFRGSVGAPGHAPVFAGPAVPGLSGGIFQSTRSLAGDTLVLMARC